MGLCKAGSNIPSKMPSCKLDDIEVKTISKKELNDAVNSDDWYKLSIDELKEKFVISQKNK